VTHLDSDAPPQQNPPVRRPNRPATAPGPLGFVRDSVLMAWRWLTRMRTALYLLALLALQTTLATIIPQEPNVPSTVTAWREGEEGPGTVVSGLIDAIGAYDVYGSALFLAFLLLLFLSLTACLIPRIRAWVRLVRRSRPPLVRHVGRTDLVRTFRTDLAPAQVHAAARQALGARRWRVRDDGDDPAAHTSADPPLQVAAEKGLWSREGGSLVFHLSFYVLLAAIVFGQLLTFEGQRGVIEGEVGFSDTALSYWSYRPGRWFGEGDHSGWRLDLDEFHVDWVRDPLAPGAGQPTTFVSDVTVTTADGEVLTDRVEGNKPLVVDGMKIHQLDWGYAPRVVVEVDGEVVHDAFLHTQATDGGFFRAAVKAPAAEPDIGLELFFYPFAPDGDDGTPVLTGAPWADAPLLLFRQWRGDLQLGATQQTINQLDTSALVSEGGGFLRVGQQLQVEGVTITMPEVRRWVGFQVSSRPQIPWLLLGAFLLVAGLIPALYAYRRRLWVTATQGPDDGRTLVTVAGRAFQRPDAFEEEHARIVAELLAATDGSLQDPVRPPGPSDVPADTPADTESDVDSKVVQR
jgi:cytochrome c biogenesis protein